MTGPYHLQLGHTPYYAGPERFVVLYEDSADENRGHKEICKLLGDGDWTWELYERQKPDWFFLTTFDRDVFILIYTKS